MFAHSCRNKNSMESIKRFQLYNTSIMVTLFLSLVTLNFTTDTKRNNSSDTINYSHAFRVLDVFQVDKDYNSEKNPFLDIYTYPSGKSVEIKPPLNGLPT